MSQYSEEDVKAIERIFEIKLSAREKEQKRKTEQEREANAETNEVFWKNLGLINPELQEKIKDTVFDAMQKDPENTIYRKDWLQKAYKEFLSGKKETAAQEDKTERKNTLYHTPRAWQQRKQQR